MKKSVGVNEKGDQIENASKINTDQIHEKRTQNSSAQNIQRLQETQQTLKSSEVM